MLNNSSPQPGHQKQPSGLLPTASQLLASLTQPQHQLLTDFAAKRLQRLATSASRQRLLGSLTPGDLVNQAIEKVLLGERGSKGGRRLSRENRENADAFLNCMKGIINSDLSNRLRTYEACYRLHLLDAEQTGTGDPTELADSLDLFALISRRDVMLVLFARLREWAASSPNRLHVIDVWEQNFLSSDRIGGQGVDPNDVYQVRLEARRYLKNLALEHELHAPDGRDMLL
jgi:hypothetical protein